MPVPKFVYDRTALYSTTPSLTKIHTGRTLFSTQNTAVYPSYTLVELKDKILVLNTSCTKAFSHNSTIVLIVNNTLKIYSDLKLDSEYPVSDSLVGLVNSYIPKDFLVKMIKADGEKEGVAGLFNNRKPIAIFSVDGKLVTIYPESIFLDSGEIENTIHVDGCRYLVAHREDLIIIANTESELFIYIADGVVVLLEDSDSLALRADEDFQACYLEDMKIQSNMVLLKDKDGVSCYRIDGVEETGEEKEVVMCEVTGKRIEISSKETKEKTELFKESSPSEPEILEVLERAAPVKAKEDVDAEILELCLVSIIGDLKMRYQQLTKTGTVPFLEYTPFSCDLTSLYNRVYNTDAKEKMEILDGMITTLEAVNNTSDHNIAESIRYFDRKIQAKGRRIGGMKYKDPLAGRFLKAVNIEKPEAIDNTLSAMSIIETNEYTTNDKLVGTSSDFEELKPEVKEVPDSWIQNYKAAQPPQEVQGTSLFSGLSGMSLFQQAPTPQSTSNDQNTSTSALDRLANSRRMFK